ncbi:hypothetical protein IWX47DRAFT_364388 [Phyllosticta citricarpa]
MVVDRVEDHQSSQNLVVVVSAGDGFANLHGAPQIHRRQSHWDQVSRFPECRLVPVDRIGQSCRAILTGVVQKRACTPGLYHLHSSTRQLPVDDLIQQLLSRWTHRDKCAQERAEHSHCHLRECIADLCRVVLVPVLVRPRAEGEGSTALLLDTALLGERAAAQDPRPDRNQLGCMEPAPCCVPHTWRQAEAERHWSQGNRDLRLEGIHRLDSWGRRGSHRRREIRSDPDCIYPLCL